MNPAAYDAEAREVRSVKRALFYLFAAVAFTYIFAGAWRLYVGPYSRFATIRQIDYKKAKEYLNTTACTDPVKRTNLEGYTRCEESRITADESPRARAFQDLMEDLKICDQGVCYAFGINWTESFWSIVKLLVVAVALLVLLIGTGAVTFGHGGGTQLPMTMISAAANEHMVSMYMQHVASKQAAQYVAPPPARHKIE